MGTSGAYGGAGGKAGRDVAAGAAEWIDNVTGGQGAGTDAPTDGSDGDAVVELPPQLVSGALTLLRPRAPEWWRWWSRWDVWR